MNHHANEKFHSDSYQPVKDINEQKIYSGITVGGIEGGATCSTLILLDERGNKLTQVEGPGTNHCILGMKEVAFRINAMICKAKQQLQMEESFPIHCVGLSLSGCEEEETNTLLAKTILQEYPNASRDYCVFSDTLGSLKTGLSSGGIVLIAGTGSNALLINPDGKTHRCGGWGDRIGDEGSAYWIAHRACKYIFDDLDDFKKAPHPITYVLPAMKKFFQVTDRFAMLPHLYGNFEKSKFSMFTKSLVAGCEEGDALCLSLFEDAGRMLAKHVEVVSTKAHEDLRRSPGGLKVICVGSVWKSWNFLKKGFINQIREGGIVDELTLMRLTRSAAVGACYLAAENLKLSSIKKNYENNADVFYHYHRSILENNGIPEEFYQNKCSVDKCQTRN